MKSEIPPRIAIAPIAIAIALALLSPLPPELVVVAFVTVGVAVVVTVGAGTPGESGLPGPCATAVVGHPKSAQLGRATASTASVAVEKRLLTA